MAFSDHSFGFEGGTNGVKVDPADPVGAGDSPLDDTNENTSTGGTLKYDTTRAAHGTKSLKVQAGAIPVSPYVEWNTTGSGPTTFYRVYIYMTALPASAFALIQTRDTAGRARLRVNTAGTISIQNGSTVVQTSTNSIALNQWVRLEFKQTVDAVSGVLEAKLFNSAGSTTATETITQAGINTGTVETTAVRIGMPVSVSNIGPIWLDSLGASATNYMGPYVVSSGDSTQFLTDTAGLTDSVVSSIGSANWYAIPSSVYASLPGDATYYTGTGSLGTAMSSLAAGKWLVLDYDGDRTEDINVALNNNVTIIAAQGRTPWLSGTLRISGGTGTRIFGLNVHDPTVGAGDHMVKLDGGSPEFAYAEVTLQDNAQGCYTLIRPGQTVTNWRVHHCWIHDNPGVSTHDGNQDHGIYASAEISAQNGRIDHCLIEGMKRGRNVKIGGPNSDSLPIGGITVDHCTLKTGYGPSNGQTSNNAINTDWHHNLLIDSANARSLTEGTGSGGGHTYSFNKSDRITGPASTNFANAGSNTDNVSLSLLNDYPTQGAAGFGHFDGYSGPAGSALTDSATDDTGLTDSVSSSLSQPDQSVSDDTGLSDSFGFSLDAEESVDPIQFDELFVDLAGLSDTFEYTNAPPSVYDFTPPSVKQRSPVRANRLFSRMRFDLGLTVLKVGASYRTVREPSAEDVENADVAYMGGRTYRVTQEERDALAEAGYGSFITLA